MTTILNNGYSVLNKKAGPSGVAVQGDTSAGSVSQYNNNETDTISAGDASKDGSIKQVMATDAADTVNLGSGWTSAGTATDQTTGITGTLYTSSSGDQLLISGGATVNNAPAPTPTPSASGANGSPSPTVTASATGGHAATPTATAKPPIFNSFWDKIFSYVNQPEPTPTHHHTFSAASTYMPPPITDYSSIGDSYFVPSDLGEI